MGVNQAGLIEVNGNYYFIGAEGKVATGKYYVWRTNGLVAEGTYRFDETGRMYGIKIVDGEKIVGEFVDIDGERYYYETGMGVRIGLFEYEGNYYYASTDGKLAIGRSYVSKHNNLVAEGSYRFDENGRMYGIKIVDGEKVVGEFVDIDGERYYYETGKGVQIGLFEYEGNYYHAGTDGKLSIGRYYVWKHNNLLPENSYRFDENGRMYGIKIVDGQKVVGEIVEIDGVKYYYEAGKGANQAGLICIDGYYYFAGAEGKLVVNQRYYVWKTNNLMPEQSYIFNELGQIIG